MSFTHPLIDLTLLFDLTHFHLLLPQHLHLHLHHTDRERLERIEREKQEAAARALALAQAQVREPYTLTKPIANHLPPHQFTRSTHPIIPSYQPTINQCSPHLLPPYIT